MTNPYPEVAHPTISKQNLHIKCSPYPRISKIYFPHHEKYLPYQPQYPTISHSHKPFRPIVKIAIAGPAMDGGSSS
jgi:hypothetical protein